MDLESREAEMLEVSSSSESNDLESESDGPSDGPHLPAPKRAAIARPRVLEKNSSRSVKRRRDETSLKLKSNADRLMEFKGEYLEHRSGLFCGACREWVKDKKSTVRNHVSSAKHHQSKAKRKAEGLRDQSLKEVIQKRNIRDRPQGETLPLDQQVFRTKVVTVLLREGIPLHKVDGLRDLLESGNFRLCSSRHLAQLVPVVHEQEVTLLKSEIAGKPLGLIYDGTTRLAEALAILVRFMDGWTIQQRLVRFDVVAKSVNAQQLASVLLQCLATTYGIKGEQVLACMRDGAAVNGAAMRHIQFYFPNMLDVTCFSHTISNVGQHFVCPELNRFIRDWVSLFSHSANARLLWKDRTGKGAPSYCVTRWWSKWEVINNVLRSFGDIRPFLDELSDSCKATAQELRQMLDDPQSCLDLKIQLAAVVDVGVHFVKATYHLEGDGPLISVYTVRYTSRSCKCMCFC